MAEKKNKWYAVDILIEADADEAVESALNELESLGTEIDCLGKSNSEPQMVTGFFDALPDADDIRTSIDESLRIYGFTPDSVKSITTRTVEETDWLAEWKKYWKPTHIGKFIIAPPWETVEVNDKIVIRIEPNMAFGTGTHETTQLCLKAIGEIYYPKQTLLDVGTGTGILAIAAAKLATENTEKIYKNLSVSSGAKILACDIDADSVKIAKENAVANDVERLIEFTDGSIDFGTPIFDFVCANLTIDVIVPILPMLISKSRSTLLLSGILAEQESLIVRELELFRISGFNIERSGEWISVTVNFDRAS